MKGPWLLFTSALAGLIVGVGLAALPESANSQESVVAQSPQWSAHANNHNCVGPPGGQWPTFVDACNSIHWTGSALLLGTTSCQRC